ncbi:putative nuclease HARBI1 [Anopheles moucheti]|uniref:putative nuclease HARBI1 n=1 Tax=Anopheles moucheti TaxID=186751 RepID=UPI0022F031F8|nr:putative nuclease HARBI1 [Anopheles moucheti]
MRNIHMPNPTLHQFQHTAEELETLTRFPNVCGCIDGKHVLIKCPNSSGSSFYDYKHFYSIHLQATADAKGKFLTVDIGDYGRRADSGVFLESNTFKNIEQNILKFPPARMLDGVEMPYVLLGDQGYPLKTYLMRSYSTGDGDEGVYNYYLSKTRRTVECAFGMLVSKWRCLKTELQVNPNHVDTIVKTTCLLHNILLMEECLDEAKLEVEALEEVLEEEILDEQVLEEQMLAEELAEMFEEEVYQDTITEEEHQEGPSHR